MINDEEDLMRAVLAYVRANLNTRIAAINTEKGDFKIETIAQDDRHYVFAGELQEIPNHIFCQIAVAGDSIATKTNRTDIISIPEFMVEIGFDNPKKPNTYFKSLRYMRALYETLVSGFESSAIEVDGFQVNKAVPMFIAYTGRELVVSGVGISAAIG